MLNQLTPTLPHVLPAAIQAARQYGGGIRAGPVRAFAGFAYGFERLNFIFISKEFYEIP